MEIFVAIKQVPDTDKVKMDPVTGTMVREGVDTIVNPLDLYAIELAIRLKEKHGGRVTAFTMGPPAADKALKEAMAMGCDAGVLVTDRAFSGSDTWATSYALSRAIAKMGRYDLILAGERATDGDTGQVGPCMAAWLDIPVLTYVGSIESSDESSIEAPRIVARRLVEEGYQRVRVNLPCPPHRREGSGESEAADAARQEIRPPGENHRLHGGRSRRRTGVSGFEGVAHEGFQDFLPEGDEGRRDREGGLTRRAWTWPWSGSWTSSQIAIWSGGAEMAEMSNTETNNVWTIAEQSGGRLKNVSFELLARGRHLADKLGVKLVSVVLADEISDETLRELIERGADEVLCIADPALADFVCETFAKALVALARERGPQIILAAATSSGRTLMPHIAVTLHAGSHGGLHRARHRGRHGPSASDAAGDRRQHHGDDKDARPQAADVDGAAEIGQGARTRPPAGAGASSG